MRSEGTDTVKRKIAPEQLVRGILTVDAAILELPSRVLKDASRRCDAQAFDPVAIPAHARRRDRTRRPARGQSGRSAGMKYVTLGRSGLKVSAICLGGNSWGAEGRRAWAPFGEADSRPFFKRALDVGINFFDTADAYNLGAGIGRKHLRHAVDAQLKRLCTDYIP